MRLQKGVPSFAILCLISTALPAFGQQVFWNNGAAGNWSNPGNWGCNCVPSAGYDAYIYSGTVTLDINANVGAVFGAPANGLSGASMTIAGTSLTTTETAYPSATFNTLTVNSGGSVTTPNGAGVTANQLIANNATLNTGVEALSANITNGSAINGTSASGLSLEIDDGTSSYGSLTLANSTVGPNGGIVTGGMSITNSTVHGTFSVDVEQPSTIVSSTFDHFGGTVQAGASLDIQQSNLGTGGAISTYGGTATLELGTQYQGVSALNVQNGGVLTLDGAGTSVTLSTSGSPVVQVGSASTPATLNVQNGAKLSAGGNTSTQLLIGNGTLNVTSGGQVSIAQVINSAGTTSMTGENSTLTSNLINLGAAGSGLSPPAGILVVENGATVNAGTINLGVSGGGGGQLSLTGGVVNYNVLNAIKGPSSAFEDDQTPIYVGGGSSLYGASGKSGDTLAINATVIGSGSLWEPRSGLTVTSGTLTIDDGGTLNTAGATLTASNSGAVKVDGSGATLSAGNFELMGDALLDVSNGGNATSSGTAISLYGAASLEVTGSGSKLTGSSLNLDSDSPLGAAGVTNGGAMQLSGLYNNSSIFIASGAGSKVTVTGLGGVAVDDVGTLDVESQAQLSVAGDLFVASTAVSPGQLNVSQGGVVTATSASIDSGSVNVYSQGQLNVTGPLTIGSGSGAATLAITGTGHLTADDVAINAQGILIVGSDASANVGSRVSIGSQGTVNVVAGSLNIGTVLLSQGQGWVTVGAGGTLSGCASDANCIVNNQFVGAGTVNGSVAIQLGGRASPGDPESFNISGDYLQTGGTLDLQIDGAQAGQFDQLIIGGSAQFSGGTFELDFGDGFAPTAGETFDLLSAANGISFSGTNFSIEGLEPGFDYTTSFADGQFDLTALNDGISSGGTPPPPSSSVPEPATWSLIASALLLLPLVNRLRKRELGYRTSRS